MFTPKVINLERVSLEGNAYTFLKTDFPAISRQRIINKTFKKYYQLLKDRVTPKVIIVPPEKPNFKKYLSTQKISLLRDTSNMFTLSIGKDIKIDICLGKKCLLERHSPAGVLSIELVEGRESSDVRDAILEIERERNSRMRRSKLSDLYASLCISSNVEPLIKYPQGTDVEYKKYIRDLLNERVYLCI